MCEPRLCCRECHAFTGHLHEVMVYDRYMNLTPTLTPTLIGCPLRSESRDPSFKP